MEEGILMTSNASVALALLDGGVILFGALLVLFGSAIPLSFLLKDKPRLSGVLVGHLSIILALLIGIIGYDFIGAGSVYTVAEIAQLSELLSTHRWILLQLPFLLVFTSLIMLLVYREKIGESHARFYRSGVIFSVVVSFATILLIGFESLV